jgi:hypothetical protein
MVGSSGNGGVNMGEARRAMCIVHGQMCAMLQTDLEIDVKIDGRCKRRKGM